MILKKTFSLIIGDLPQDKRERMWRLFEQLLVEVARAGAEGAVRGARDE